jgi:hypothetical protein
LVLLDRLEERLEVAFAKAFVALRWMISKKTDPMTVPVKIRESKPPFSGGAPSTKISWACGAGTSSPWPDTRARSKPIEVRPSDLHDLPALGDEPEGR